MSSRQRSETVDLVQLYDQRNDRAMELDSVENTLPMMTRSHHTIHEGNHYTVAVLDADVDIAGPKYVRITTPNTTARIHFNAVVSAGAAATVEFYENPTLNAAGNGLTEYNNDRNSTNTAVATTFEDTTTQAPNNDGTLLFAFRVGGTGVGQTSVSGEGATREEWILDQNQDYLVKVTVDADNTQVLINFLWYEVV